MEVYQKKEKLGPELLIGWIDNKWNKQKQCRIQLEKEHKLHFSDRRLPNKKNLGPEL